MSSYGFRIKFLVPRVNRIQDELQSIEINLPDSKQLLLKSALDNSIGESNELILLGGGFSSEEEAYAYGIRAKNSLIVCSSILQVGIDVGVEIRTNEVELCTPQALQDLILREEGTRLLDNVYGLSVYPEDNPICISFTSAFGIVGMPAEKFVNEFIKAYNLEPHKFTDKQLLAFELYSWSHFESSSRAKFITLVTVIECLSHREKQTQDIVSHIEKLIDVTKNELADSEEKFSTIERLGDLKRESISNACRKLVDRYLGKEDMKVFNTCYTIRSQLVHTGKVRKNIDFNEYLFKLNDIVSRLLIESIKSAK